MSTVHVPGTAQTIKLTIGDVTYACQNAVIRSFDHDRDPVVPRGFCTIDAHGLTLDSQPPPASEAEKLAHAVLKGERLAALALADEVQLEQRLGESFVSRDSLVSLLDRWYSAPRTGPDKELRIDTAATLQQLAREKESKP